jgi:hypothetical protein
MVAVDPTGHGGGNLDPGDVVGGQSARWREDARIPPCGSDDLAVSVRWTRAVGGGLRGEVVAENVSGRACRLGNKPALRPLGLDGQPLGVDQAITLELRLPPFVILQPGRRASASISWSGWSGRPASGRIIVFWEGGSAAVDAEGPVQPGPPERGAGGLSSSWFTLIS